MEEKIRDIETRLLSTASLQNKSKTFRSLNETIRKYLSELEELRDKINDIDAKIMNYDIIDFLNEKIADMNTISLEIVVSIMQDIKTASLQFREDNSAEYLDRSSELWKKVRRMGFLRINEVIYRSTESLMLDPNFHEFVKLLDEKTIYRVKLKVLQSRKVECLKKAVHIKKNKEFLFRSMIQQELCIFFKLFPEEQKHLEMRLRDFEEEKTLTSSMLFECFSFSILKEYFRSCTPEDLEDLKSRMQKKLEDGARTTDPEHQNDESIGSEEFFTDVLVFISVRSYLSSRPKPESLPSDEVVEI